MGCLESTERSRKLFWSPSSQRTRNSLHRQRGRRGSCSGNGSTLLEDNQFDASLPSPPYKQSLAKEKGNKLVLRAFFDNEDIRNYFDVKTIQDGI